MAVKPTDTIHESWKPLLTTLTNKNFTNSIKQAKKLSPEWSQVFRAFSMPFNEVKVLIVALGHPANGLIFNTRQVDQLRDNLAYEYNELFIEAWFKNDLTHWINNGVMMLNISLTSNKKGEYINLWKPFISEVIKECSEVLRIPVWLMGKDAMMYEELCVKSFKSLNLNPTEMKFKEINEYLTHVNGEEYKINWTNYEET